MLKYSLLSFLVPVLAFADIDYNSNLSVSPGLAGSLIENVTKTDASALVYSGSDSSTSSDSSHSIDFALSLVPGYYEFDLDAAITRFSSSSGNASSFVDISINSNGDGDLLTFSNPGGGAFSVTFALDYSNPASISPGSTLGNFTTTNYSAFFYQDDSFNGTQRFDHLHSSTSGYSTLDVNDEVFSFTGTSGTLEIRNLFLVEAYAFGNGVDPAGARATNNSGYFNLYIKEMSPGVTFTSTSGAIYGVIPEPAASTLLVGLACLLWLAARHRQR